MNLNPQSNNSQEQEFTVNQHDMDVQKKIESFQRVADFKAGIESRAAVVAAAAYK